MHYQFGRRDAEGGGSRRSRRGLLFGGLLPAGTGGGVIALRTRQMVVLSDGGSGGSGGNNEGNNRPRIESKVAVSVLRDSSFADVMGVICAYASVDVITLLPVLIVVNALSFLHTLDIIICGRAAEAAPPLPLCEA